MLTFFSFLTVAQVAMAGLAKFGIVEVEFEKDIPFTDTKVSYKATRDEPLYLLRFDKKPTTQRKTGFVRVNRPS